MFKIEIMNEENDLINYIEKPVSCKDKDDIIFEVFPEKSTCKSELEKSLEDIKNLKKEIETKEKFNPSKNFSICTCQQFTINGSTKIQRILSTTHDIEDVLIPVYSYIES